MTEPVRLKHNEFWGRRSGGWEQKKPKNIATPWGWIFKVKRGATKSSDNQGAVGHKTRWYLERALSKAKRPIRNPEHQKINQKEERKKEAA